MSSDRNENETRDVSTTEGLPIAPSLSGALRDANISKHIRSFDERTLLVSGIAGLIAVVCTFVAFGLVKLISFVTNLAFFGDVSFRSASPELNHLGIWVIAVPIIGSFFVGLMAR